VVFGIAIPGSLSTSTGTLSNAGNCIVAPAFFVRR